MKTRLLTEDAMLPCFMTEGAACADVFLPIGLTIEPHQTIKVPLNIAFDLDPGTKVVMYPRSSLLVKRGLIQPVSIIDEDYHGNVHVPLHNLTDEPVHLERHERVAQIEVVKAREVSTDWNTDSQERDQNGFGGTGK